MPVFNYVCDSCGETKEKLGKYSDIIVCDCGKEMRKGVAKVAFELKGKGWFKDGYSK